MKKIGISLVGLLFGVGLYAQSLLVAPQKLSIEAEMNESVSSATIGVAATSPISDITVSSSESWMTISPASFNLTSNNLSTNITVSFNINTKAPANYSGTITVADTGGTFNVSIPVSLIIKEPVGLRTKQPNVILNYKRDAAIDPTQITPTRVGDILIYVYSNKVYISKGLTSSDWIELK